MIEVVLTRSPEKELRALSSETRRRIVSALQTYASDPLAHARKLTNPRIGTYRFRVGDWRIIFDLDQDTLVVLRIGHRREIYR